MTREVPGRYRIGGSEALIILDRATRTSTTPKGPCSQIDILWPYSSPYLGTLGPKYIYLRTWTLRECDLHSRSFARVKICGLSPTVLICTRGSRASMTRRTAKNRLNKSKFRDACEDSHSMMITAPTATRMSELQRSCLGCKLPGILEASA